MKSVLSGIINQSKFSNAERITVIQEHAGQAAAIPGPDYEPKLDRIKKRSMSIKIDQAKTGRTDQIKKTNATDFFNTRDAHQKSTFKAPQTVFGKSKKLSYVEQMSRNKNPGAGDYKTERAYSLISPSNMMRKRC